MNDKNYRVLDYQEYLKKTNKDINKDYEWVKSIIMGIFPYPTFEIEKKDDYFLPSYFARIKDYHQVIKEELINKAKEFNLEKFEVLVDDSFLNEKICGELLGFGFIGKNSLLINKEYGSRFFIGEIVTDKQFDYIQYEKVLYDCGECSDCIKACPNKALDNDFEKEKCLSYLSQKTTDNLDLYRKMTSYYGCDICQNVCKYNKNLDQNRLIYLNDFKNVKKECLISINEIVNLTNKEFKEKYKDFTFNWMSKNKIERNINIIKDNNINRKK